MLEPNPVPKKLVEDTKVRAAKFNRDFVRGEAEKLKARAQRRRVERPDFASVDHLNPEAIAAYVDDELSDVAKHRARIHMIHCEECRVEVSSQRSASQRIKACSNDDVHAPSSLIAKLAQIESLCPSGPTAEDTADHQVSLIRKLENVAKSFKRGEK